MNTQDQFISYVRTGVNLLVGFLLTWLAKSLDIVIDPSTGPQLVALFMFVVTFVYYVVVRLIERKWPQAGVLLGIPKPPVYPSAPGENNSHPLPYRH